MKKKFLFVFLFCFLVFSSCVYASSSIEINSPVGLLVEDSTGKILYEKGANERMYPASTTKILTALLVLENGNLDDSVTVSKEAVTSLTGGYVTSYISIGEVLTVEQLLNILLVHSANVAGNVLAEYVSGSIDDFVVLMNSRARELGCTNTHFTNPYGKHDENHYTTAHDLYLMAKEAMKHEIFRTIVAKPSYVLAPTNRYSRDDRLLYATNDLIKPSSNLYYEYALGIKTGFTSQAKDCLVSAAQKDNMTLYSVVLGAEDSSSGVSYRYIDAKKLFEYGFNNYMFRTIRSKGSVLDTVDVSGATQNTKSLNLVLDSTISAFISIDDAYTSFSPEVVLYNLTAPIAKDTVVGTVFYNVNGTVYSSNLLAGSDVEKSYMFVLVDIGIVIFIMIIFKMIINNKKRKKKNRRK